MQNNIKKIEFILVDGCNLEIKYDNEEALEDELNKSLKNQIILRLLRDIATSYKKENKTQIEYVHKLNKYFTTQLARISDEVFNKGA